ncbi:MAG: hypothetical protein LBL59_06755 [Xanthomonadaceae bacterium]|jgi:uncharacterized protein YecT (DUF1311 family)|nr:hypothetical protein [Xanthomonadaceae bacterium]
MSGDIASTQSDCLSGATDDLSRRGQQSLRNSDRKLNGVHRTVMALATDDQAPRSPIALAAFGDNLRDADVAAKLPNGAGSVTDDRAIAPMRIDSYKAQLTDERRHRLELRIDGTLTSQ